MDIPLDEVLFFDAITSNASGAAADADGAVSFEVFEEGTDTDIGVGGNMTKRTGKDGNYRGSITLSAANGFEAGKWYSVVATATVGGNAGKAVLKSFRVVAAETSVGVPKVDSSHWRGQAIPETNQTGVPIVDVAYVDGTGVEPGVVDANVVSMATDAISADALSAAAVAKIEAALLNEGDGQALIDAIVQAIDAADIDHELLPALIRDAILNRVLSGNHDIAGSLGKILQAITEARLAELDAGNLPADVAAIPKVGESHRYTNLDTSATADVSIAVVP